MREEMNFFDSERVAICKTCPANLVKTGAFVSCAVAKFHFEKWVAPTLIQIGEIVGKEVMELPKDCPNKFYVKDKKIVR